MKKLICFVLAILMVLPMMACGKKTATKNTAEVDPQALLQVLLEQVKYDVDMEEKTAAVPYPGMPETAKVRTFAGGDGSFADRVIMVSLAQASDMDAAKASLEEYLSQLKNQYINYVPEEVDKIENPVFWQQGTSLILCVTNDYENAQDIVDHAAEKTKDVTVTMTTTEAADVTPEQTQGGEEVTTPSVTEPIATEPPVVDPVKYPAITSKSGTYRKTGGSYIVDDSAFENYKYDENAASAYAAILNTAAQELKGKVKVYFLPIPTAIGIVLPDDIPAAMGDSYQDQHQRMGLIFNKLDSSIIQVDCFDNLMRHRNEYLYFRTDFHWNGKAAYYAYEIWCKEKGVTPYTLDQRELSTFDGFLGGLYQNDCKKDPALRADTVEAYHPYSENVSMVFTDKKGNQIKWNVISNVSSSPAGTKYNTFAGGDNPITVYKNPDVTDGSVGVVVKESFGNALMPYMVDHYSTLYEIDYRYWQGDIADFCLEVGAKDLTFANNMGMIRAAVLVEMLADNF